MVERMKTRELVLSRQAGSCRQPALTTNSLRPPYSSNHGTVLEYTALLTTKDIIIIILVQAFSTRHLRRFTRHILLIEPNVQQANLQPVATHHVDELAGLGGDGLLIQQHQQPVQPLGCYRV